MREKLLRGFDRLAARASATTFRSRSYDVIDMAFFKAGLDAAEFYEQHLTTAEVFDDHDALIDHAVGMAKPDGLFLEFGVATGRTITRIAGSRDGAVFGFDSFEGLPESWYAGYGQGSFARTDLPPVPDNVTLVKGWFDETLPGWLAENPGNVSFLHVDSDLYSSAAFVLEQLADRIGPGTVILFDEYFNYPGWRAHEHKAWHEFVAAHNIRFRWDSFLRVSQPVCVVVE